MASVVTPGISPTLHENPRANLKRWEESVASAARAYCTSYTEWGALHVACSDATWQAANGNPAIPALRPANVDPGPLDPAANPAARQTHKETLKRFQDFAQAAASLRETVLASIRPSDVDDLRDPDTGLLLVTANSAIQAMVAAHGLYIEVDIDI